MSVKIKQADYEPGRTLREVGWIMPEADFPSPDDNPPLKVALLRV